MGRYLALLGLVAGCKVDAVLSDPVFDTDVAETDADADTDADTDVDTEPPAPLTWTGTRVFEFPRYCTDTVYETGVEVTNDPTQADATNTCGDCDAVFRIQASPEAICDGTVGISTTIFRGVKWNGDQATIYLLSNENAPGWYREELAVGTVSGATITYSYQKNYNGFDYFVDGQATIE
jgi:hypothetical protein